MNGPGGGTWTFRADPSGTRIVAGQDGAPVTLAIASAHLLDMANRKLTPVEFRVEGNIALLDRPFS